MQYSVREALNLRDDMVLESYYWFNLGVVLEDVAKNNPEKFVIIRQVITQAKKEREESTS